MRRWSRRRVVWRPERRTPPSRTGSGGQTGCGKAISPRKPFSKYLRISLCRASVGSFSFFSSFGANAHRLLSLVPSLMEPPPLHTSKIYLPWCKLSVHYLAARNQPVCAQYHRCTRFSPLWQQRVTVVLAFRAVEFFFCVWILRAVASENKRIFILFGGPKKTKYL